MIKSDTRMGTTEPFVKLTTATLGNEIDSSRAARTPERSPLEGRAVLMSEEEVLIIDDRSGLSPAQAVENKLSRMLMQSSLPVSQLQMRGILRAR